MGSILPQQAMAGVCPRAGFLTLIKYRALADPRGQSTSERALQAETELTAFESH
jgi:hypothetical protein